MAGNFRAGILVTATLLLSHVEVVMSSLAATLTLERIFTTNHGVELGQLRARDRVRHRRMLQSSGRVIDFPVDGTYDPYLVGLYYTKVQLGTPPKDFYVQIDTGSNVLWVSCSACNGCPQTSGLQIPLNFYDPRSSSSGSPISCSDPQCGIGARSSDSFCSAQNNQCGYSFQYGDGSGTSGFYVSDLMHFDTIVGNSITSNASASVIFGCSTSQTGDLTKSDRAVNGILGFGQQDLSVISQLSSQGIAPKVFSHCLKGDGSGGGILVLGEIVEPNMVFSPLVPSAPHYNLKLQSISVNGQPLSIDPSVFAMSNSQGTIVDSGATSSVFATSNSQGTIVDSGTTLAYFAEEAYDTLIAAIKNIVSQSAQAATSRGNQCYMVTSSVSEIFPPVSLNFAGGASLILGPQDYLIQQNSIRNVAVWCIGFQKIEGQGMTILGDLVLKDKIFVYDLAGQRIGWANYDCSMPVNVSTTTTGKSEYVNAGQLNDNSSERNVPHRLILMNIILWQIHVSFPRTFQFL